ncbi:MAG: hypothetical protein HY596_04585 [Candidatus Omnitrophica bacterium]|nr:hypothetical protein [Candidatus Omnitrophota bacterium]
MRRPDTPWPWINYLTNEQYCAIISHCAGGYSFYKDCRTDRVTRWAPENYKVDRPGRYLYIREQEAEGRKSRTVKRGCGARPTSPCGSRRRRLRRGTGSATPSCAPATTASRAS